MTEQWEEQETKYAHRSTAQRFKITYEQIDLVSWMKTDANDDINQNLTFERGFGEELLAAIGDHLSINDLTQISQVFTEELKLRLSTKYNAYLDKH